MWLGEMIPLTADPNQSHKKRQVQDALIRSKAHTNEQSDRLVLSRHSKTNKVFDSKSTYTGSLSQIISDRF